ncbi:MAG TPA: POTRA domain-containing protein [Candidatus Dormibacteraeota bacterium]|nr:POTRA domain-containing protein [Candidatus Dormibacteraeota bacterium]
MARLARQLVSLRYGALLFCLTAVPVRGLPGQQKETTLPTPSQDPAPSSHARIVAMRIVSEDESIALASPVQIPLKPGDLLDPEVLRESLRSLYRTGRYADVRAVAAPVPGGLSLDFVVKHNYFVNLVRIEGIQEPPSEGVALASLRLTPGEIFRQANIDAALDRLRETLREDGLYQARVTAALAPHADTRQMDIFIRVEPGLRARLSKVSLKNHTEFPDDALEDRSHLKAGRLITSANLKKSADRIRKFLASKEHLSARVITRRGVLDPAANQLPLEIEVSAGPRVRVDVKGSKIRRRDLRKLLPIYAEGAVDDDLLEEGRRNILDRLERNGYFDAKVQYTISEIPPKETPKGVTPGELLIAYTVERDIRHRFDGVTIEGNHYFSATLLRGRLQLQPSTFSTRARFSKKLVQSDAAAMRDLYVANGFRDAQVIPETLDDYKRKKGDIFVRFVIHEGPQTRVASLKIEGNKALTEDDLLAVVGSTPGQPFSEFDVASDRDNILALYYNEGFPEARFTSSVIESPPSTPSAETSPKSDPTTASDSLPGGDGAPKSQPLRPRTVSLAYRIEEGPQSRVRRVLVGGYLHTRPGVIRREIQVKTQGPLRQGEVIETQRRLYNLGIFSRVSVGTQNPTGNDPDKTVLVLVDEGKRYTLGYGGGFEVQRLASRSNAAASTVEASPRGIFEISKNNFTGRADALSFKVRASTLQGRALLSYIASNYFGKPQFSLQATAYADKTRDVNTFTSTRYEGSLQLAHRVTPFTSFIYRYSFRKVLVSSISSSLSPEVIPLISQPTLVSGFGLTWFRDHRDNPADAEHGRFNTIDVAVNSTSLGSSSSFARLFFQNSTFHTVAKRYTFARSARIGVLQPFQGTVSLAFPPQTVQPLPRVIPLPERFFAGGGTTLRSFALNQAGPRDSKTGFPVGGQALLIFNQELRFPMRLPYLGTRLGGAVFYDAGNVYSRLSHVSLRWRAPKPVFDPANPATCVTNCSNELNYLSHTIGFGLRYSTPIGPVRVDLGYQLNPPTFAIDCSGGPANCKPGATLSRFQIFFNLGSIF